MDFGCCHGFCESQAAEVINTEALTSEGRGDDDNHGTFKEQPEQENSSPKMRLRRVIRDFAHKVVGQGIEIEAHSPMLAPSALPGVLRMDKRLSRLEIQTRTVSVTISLTDVSSFKKGLSLSPGMSADQSDALKGDRDNVALTVIQESGTDMELIFESSTMRDQAFTCFKIFHMSVFQSMDGQSFASSAENTVSSPGDLKS
mmetsp:Transcript_41456/g.65732  ORF Transcript_41456/g.65732 Transcript_41456/m.65732 type:complete len:201 (-) Transcript_41456:41-643(-)